MQPTYLDLMLDALSDNDERPEDVIDVSRLPSNGGSLMSVYFWTEKYVYYWDYNDGDERFAPAPRNPPAGERAPIAPFVGRRTPSG